jgi:hypothetical protein
MPMEPVAPGPVTRSKRRPQQVSSTADLKFLIQLLELWEQANSGASLVTGVNELRLMNGGIALGPGQQDSKEALVLTLEKLQDQFKQLKARVTALNAPKLVSGVCVVGCDQSSAVTDRGDIEAR